MAHASSRRAGRRGAHAGSGLYPLLVTPAVALLVRIVYLLSSSGNPFRTNPGLDTEVYDAWARAILNAPGLGEAPFTQAPLFPLMLSFAYAVLGGDPVRAHWAHLLPGTAAVLLTSWIALRLRGPAAAWIAGGLLALYKPAIFYTGVLLPPTWAVCMTALALAAVVRAVGTGDGKPGASCLHAGLAGLAFGLLALAQPAALGMTVPAVFLLYRCGPPRLRAPAWFILGVALPLAATFMYNGLAGRAWSPVAVNGGINLYIGNGPGASGAYVRPPEMREDRDLLGIEAARRLSVAEGRPGSVRDTFGPADADRFWRSTAVNHMLEHPGATLRLYLRKLLFFFGQYEIPQVESLPFEKRYSLLLRLPLPGMALLTALAVFGAVLLYRRCTTVKWLVWSAAALAFGTSVFFITARFRLPAAPVLAILAGAGMAEGFGSFKWKESIPAAGLAVAAGILLSLNPARIDTAAGDGQHQFRTGILLEREGRTAEAEDAYRTALSLDPSLGKAHVNLGTLLARRGDLAGARRHLEQGVALDPQSAIGFVNLGDLHRVEGRLQDALHAYGRAISVEPDRISAVEGSALMLYELGRIAESAGFLVAAQEIAPPGSPPFLRSRSLLAILAGRQDAGAGEEWALDADLRRADVLLARLETEEAAALYRRVMESGANADSRAEAARMLALISPRS